MKTIKFAAIFFYLLSQFLVSFLYAQEGKRIKLLDSHKILLNGDTVLISNLETVFLKEIRDKINASCQRNLEIALQAMESQPKKSYYMLNEAIKLDSTFIPAYAALTKLFLNVGQIEKAYNTIDIALQYNEDDNLLLAKAKVLEKLNQEKKAIDLTKTITATNKTKSKAAYIRGSILYKRGNNKQAFDEFDAASKIDGSMLESHLAKAVVLQNEGKIDEAISLFDSLYNQNNENILVLYHLAFFKKEAQDFDRAFALLSKIENKDSTFTDAYFLKGEINYQLNKFEESIDDFQKSTINNTTQTEKIAAAYSNISACYYKLENFEEAEKAATGAIEINNTLAEAFLNRGNAREMLRKEIESCEDWHQAIKLGLKNIAPLIKGYCEVNTSK